MFKNVCVFCNLGLHVLLCLLGQLGHKLLLGVAKLGLLLPLLLQGGCDGLVLPANLVCQTPKEGELRVKR